MSPHTRHRRGSGGGLAALLSRQRMYVALVVVAALTLGTAMALSTRAFSHAATTAASTAPNDGGVTWTPGQVAQHEETAAGGAANGCTAWVDMTGSTVSAADSATESAVNGALDNLAQLNINQSGIQDEDIETITPGGSTSETVDPQADVDCSLITNAAASLQPRTTVPIPAAFLTTLSHRGAESTGARFERDGVVYAAVPAAQALAMAKNGDFRDAALPSWLRGAVGAIAGAVLYVAVSAVVVGTMVALGAATGASGGLTSPILAAFAGCIGGAVSTAATITIATGSTNALSAVSSAVAGCLTGGLIGGLPANQLGPWVANQLGNLGVGALAGSSLEGVASAAGVELTPVTQALTDAAAALATP